MPIDPLAAVAALALPTTAAFPEAPLGERQFASFVTRVRADRMSGLLAASVATERFLVTDEQHEIIAQLDADVQVATVRLESSLFVIGAALAGAGIPYRVLKGPAFAHVYWPDPAWRPFIDLDLLVPSAHLDAAVTVAEGLGARRDLPQLRRHFDRRFGKNVNLATASVAWELHRTLLFGPHMFFVNEHDLWRHGVTFQIASREFEAPSPEVSLVHACMHATLTEAQRLTTLRDVVEIASVADLREAAAIATAWRVTPAVVRAVSAAHNRLRLTTTPLQRWAMTLSITTEEQRIVDALARARTQAQLAIVTLRHVPGVSAKVAYAFALGWPNADSRRARGRRRLEQAQRLVRALREKG